MRMVSAIKFQAVNLVVMGSNPIPSFGAVSSVVEHVQIHPVFYLNTMGMHSANFTKSNFYFDTKRIPKFGLVAQLDRATAF